eukprot:911897-Pleurochrysis_carterae.AAC.1
MDTEQVSVAWRDEERHDGFEPELVERERAKKQKPPVGVCGRNNAARKQPETSVSLKSRLASYPHQSLEIRNGQLFCKACKKVICNVQATLERHLASANHAEKVVQLEQTKVHDMRLTDSIAAYYKNHPDDSSM